ncbi:MAG: hypothetical protein AAF716_03110 [Cyanobacteria bacterium P01_D01_bin.1]
MVASAADPVKQRYTAGSCALEITLQPSALSQWSQRLVTDDLTFRLWLAEGGSTTAEEIRATKQIVAEGNHLVLQAIARYIQARTRQTLAVSPYETPYADPLSSREAESPAAESPSDSIRPPEFQYPNPISYLQLCDLNIVICQYEQSVSALPAAAEQLGENIILLEAVRDRRPTQSPSATQPLPKPKRKRLWAASSAAAALLLAVGLTTALRYRNTALQEFTTANNTAAGDQSARMETDQQADSSQVGSSQSDGSLADGSLADGSLADDLQLDGSQPETLEDSALDADSAQPADALPALPSTPSPGRTTGPLPRIPTRPERSLSRDLTRSPVTIPPTTTGSAGPPVQNAPAASLPTTPPNPISTEPISPSGDSGRGGSGLIAPSPPVLESSQDSLFADQFETASAPNTAESSTASSASPSAGDSVSRSQAGTSQADISQTSTSQANTSQADGAQSANARSSEQSSSFAPIVSQVQNYFQQRWRGGSETALVYELQLAADGTVASFAAINEAAEQEGDRIFPSTAQPSFAIDPGASTSTLRVLLNGDGTVQVIKTR